MDNFMSSIRGLSLGLIFLLTACSPVMPGLPSDQGGATTNAAAGSGATGSNAAGSNLAAGTSSTMVGAPGPVAGVGLPILAVVGGLAWIKSRKRREDRLQK
jgi:hypothetical protein